MSTKQLRAALLGVALASFSFGMAHADPVTFTWTPSAVGLTGGTISGANNMNVSDFANVQITNATGAFTETGGLVVNTFLNGGTTLPSTGLGTTYSLYFVFSGAGTGSSIPAAGSSTNGTFTSLNYTLYAKSGSNPSFNVTTSPVGISGNSGAFVLGSGSLISGITTLTNTGSGFSPTANLDLTFSANPAESAFFTAPPPSDLNIVISNFSASTSVTTLVSGPSTSALEINGGGGNLTFQTARVPEPSSLVLLGSGLIGLRLLARRRRKA